MSELKRLNLDHETDGLRRFILENPDLPIVILADESSVIDNGAWTFCSKISVKIDVILDCEYYDYGDMVITDRDRLEEIIEDNLYEKYHDKPESEYDAAIKAEVEKFEPYWKKVIAVWATN